MMKIVYIIDRLVDAGTQRHLYRLARGLHRQHRENYDIRVICLEEEGYTAQKFREIGIRVSAFHTGAYYTLDTLRKVHAIANYLAAEKPGIVENYLLKANLLGTAAAGMAGVPVILSTRRSMGYDFKPNHVEMLKFIDRNWTAGVVVNSQAAADITMEREKVAPGKIHLVYNGIDGERFHQPRDQTLKQEFKIPAEAVVLGAVGNIRPVKGYEYLLSALEKAAGSCPQVCLLIVGNVYQHGEYFQKLEKQAKELNIRSRVVFLQNCPDIPGVLSLVDIALLPSLSEGFSNTLLEYMAAQKPIIATAVGGNPEAITHEESGLLVPPRDSPALAGAITRLLKDRDFAAKLAVNARKRVLEKFSLEKMIENYRRLYKKLSGE